MKQRMMKQRTMILGLAIGGIAPIAHADGTGIWLWDVTTDNGDAIVEPGETASVTLSMHMLAEPGDNVVGISATIFDTLGGLNAAKGHIVGWEIHNGLAELTGDVTTTDGVSLFGTNAGQLTVFGPFTDANPVDVLTFQWAPDMNGAYTVEYLTSTDSLLVWEGDDQDVAMAVPYDKVEAAISFQVVPTPGSTVVGALGVLALGRRVRRSRR